MEKTREFQVFVKPVGAVCNLDCSYCYYLEKKDLFPSGTRFLMSKDLLELYIIQHFEASTASIVNFSWHGGEPLLAGIDFYRDVVRLQKKHQPQGTTVLNGIQTNGTLLDDEWCSFFALNGFTVGVSIDGPDKLHNNNRRTQKGEDTLNDVLRGFNNLKKHGIIPELLCVVNSENVRTPLTVYDFIKKLGPTYVAFLPLVEPDMDSSSGVSENSVPSREFGMFLSAVFDKWVENDIGAVKIQIFEEAARTAFNQDHTLCIFKAVCGGVPVVEHNGDFYSCDHYVNSDYLLGNINDNSLSYFLESERQRSFGESKLKSLPQYCLQCEVREMCNGECPKNRFILTPDGDPGLNYLCEGYKYFFNHCKPFVDAISEAWRNQMKQN